ncbi:MAG: MOSC domain-containing protein [Synechococcales cyanobacterium M58_A2018_015]|nr:MOSC domain-containing protein [Synechococcales cyanobacterium M58_A2018_015]
MSQAVGSAGFVGTLVSLWRYPVKSMLGEELNAALVSDRGLVGDRAYALIDRATGMTASAKNPRKWGQLFDCRAAFTATPDSPTALPTVKMTLPDGREIRSDTPEVHQILSALFGREVTLETQAPTTPSLEEYWPSIEGLPHQDAITDEATLASTFFDGATVHLLTTATLDQLQALAPASRFETRRFRPNLVVAPDAATGFVENDWIGKTVAIGDRVRLHIQGPCPRCVMTTMPQSELPADLEILKTAVRHNQGNVGVYARVLQGGTLKRGDAVHLES